MVSPLPFFQCIWRSNESAEAPNFSIISIVVLKEASANTPGIRIYYNGIVHLSQLIHYSQELNCYKLKVKSSSKFHKTRFRFLY